MDNMLKNKLYIVVPCYNEEEVLPETSKRLREKMRALIDAGKIDPESRVVLVNDGSKDRTWELISALHSADRLFSGICLSRNRGHQNALLAGLMTVKDKADMVISMDADLQDDINAVDAMVDKYLDGCDIVYGVRSKREKDSAFKRLTAEGYYKVISAMGGEIVFNHADYRLMSRRALEALSRYGERNLFLRGIIPMLGFKTDTVTYERSERFAGESKYPLKKMLALAGDGITSLSAKPIHFISAVGILFIAFSIVFLAVSVIMAIFGHSMLNWKIIIFSLFFVGGFIMLALGIVGEYVGKVFLETKARPRYIVQEVLHED